MEEGIISGHDLALNLNTEGLTVKGIKGKRKCVEQGLNAQVSRKIDRDKERRKRETKKEDIEIQIKKDREVQIKKDRERQRKKIERYKSRKIERDKERR